MKKILKRIGIVLLVIFLVIQVFRAEKNLHASSSLLNDVTKVYAVTQPVSDILKTSCYDCHSNNTVYPWYANVQPVAWWLGDHVSEGKKELNFSEFASYSVRRQYKKMEEIIDELTEDKMPLGSYTLIHRNAELTKAQKDQLINWATAIRDTMKATYPPDSLIRKK